MRNYDDFIDAYFNFHRDGFCPDKFHYWAGISAIGAALERKAYIPWTKSLSFYPNLYILFVANPGMGKSTAIMPVVKILQHVRDKYEGTVNLMPSQVTEAELINLMANLQSTYQEGSMVKTQSAGFYYASEASASLKNVYGSFVDMVTALYDCDPLWEKSTVKAGKISIVNGCFNLLAGSTFDYLGKLITGDSIMGGFASRLNYIVQKEAFVRKSPWQGRGSAKQSDVKWDALAEDLGRINKIAGPFMADEGYAAAYEEWFPAFDGHRQSIESEKMQSLKVRKQTNILKLSMIVSASESSERKLTVDHWKRALKLADELDADLPDMLRESTSQQLNTQNGINAAIFKILKKRPMKKSNLHRELLLMGHSSDVARKTIETMAADESSLIRTEFRGNSLVMVLTGDPDNYL